MDKRINNIKENETSCYEIKFNCYLGLCLSFSKYQYFPSIHVLCCCEESSYPSADSLLICILGAFKIRKNNF